MAPPNPDLIKQMLLNGGVNPLYGAQQSDPSAPPPQPPTPAAPPSGTIAASMPQNSAPPAQSAAPPSTPNPSTPAPSAASQPSPQANAPIAGAPEPYHHGTLAKILLGVGEALGNPLASRIGQRDREREQEISEYNRPGNVAALQNKANLSQQEAESTIAEKKSNIQRTQYDMGKEQQTEKANYISQIMQEVESGKYGDGTALLGRWRRIAQANPHIGLTDEDIQGAISGTHPLGAKYTLIKGEGGRPEGLQDRTGNQYTPDQITKQLANDPDAQNLWTSAQQGHQTERGEKMADEKAVAGYAAERQGAGFAQAEKMKALGEIQPRINTALDANERLSRMEASYAKAVKGDQQAQLSLLADHIGMTFGLQKNVKANKALIQEAQESQPWLQKLDAKFDDRGILSGVALGPEQMKQMLDLGYGARDRAFASAHEAATSYGQPLPPGFEKVEAQRAPGSKPALGQQGGAEGPTATGPNGHKIKVVEGKWVDAATGQPIQ